MNTARVPLAIFSHPGHELRLLYSLKALGVQCVFLTDASASTGQARLHLTDETLENAGIKPRIDFPTLPDGALYEDLRTGQTRYIDAILERLLTCIESLQPTFLITDSAEGYNPAHDLCHFLGLRLGQMTGLDVFDVALDGDPADFGEAGQTACKVFDLDAPALAEKLGLIAEYANRAGPQLAGEAKGLLEKYGHQAQGLEVLRPALGWQAYDQRYCAETPFFEVHGKRRVAEGKYTSALTYQDHLRPALAALLDKS